MKRIGKCGLLAILTTCCSAEDVWYNWKGEALGDEAIEEKAQKPETSNPLFDKYWNHEELPKEDQIPKREPKPKQGVADVPYLQPIDSHAFSLNQRRRSYRSSRRYYYSPYNRYYYGRGYGYSYSSRPYSGLSIRYNSNRNPGWSLRYRRPGFRVNLGF